MLTKKAWITYLVLRRSKKWVFICSLLQFLFNIFIYDDLFFQELFELVEQADIDGLKQKIELKQVSINW